MNWKAILEPLAFGLACFILGGYFLPPVARQHIGEWVQALRTPKSKRKPREPEIELRDDWKHDPITRDSRSRETAAAPITTSEDQPDQSSDALSAALEMSDEPPEGLSAESGPHLSDEENLGGEECDQREDQGNGQGPEGGMGVGDPEGNDVVPDKVEGIIDEGLGEGESTRGDGSPFGAPASEPDPEPAPLTATPEQELERAKRFLRDRGFSVLKREEPEKKRKVKRRAKRKSIKKK
jgi:hypothetical protein